MNDCKGGDEVGVDWINELVLHQNDQDWHADSLLFAEATDARFDEGSVWAKDSPCAVCGNPINSNISRVGTHQCPLTPESLNSGKDKA